MNLAGGQQMGFIAQEVESVLPMVVDTDAEGYKSVQYSKLVPLLVEAIKQQQALILKQQSALDSNAASIEAMQAQLDNLVQFLQNTGFGTPADFKVVTD
jgi:hypothetical protein